MQLENVQVLQNGSRVVSRVQGHKGNHSSGGRVFLRFLDDAQELLGVQSIYISRDIGPEVEPFDYSNAFFRDGLERLHSAQVLVDYTYPYEIESATNERIPEEIYVIFPEPFPVALEGEPCDLSAYQTECVEGTVCTRVSDETNRCTLNGAPQFNEIRAVSIAEHSVIEQHLRLEVDLMDSASDAVGIILRGMHEWENFLGFQRSPIEQFRPLYEVQLPGENRFIGKAQFDTRTYLTLETAEFAVVDSEGQLSEWFRMSDEQIQEIQRVQTRQENEPCDLEQRHEVCGEGLECRGDIVARGFSCKPISTPSVDVEASEAVLDRQAHTLSLRITSHDDGQDFEKMNTTLIWPDDQDIRPRTFTTLIEKAEGVFEQNADQPQGEVEPSPSVNVTEFEIDLAFSLDFRDTQRQQELIDGIEAVEVQVRDIHRNESEIVQIPLRRLEEVGVGEACDLARNENMCVEEGACEPVDMAMPPEDEPVDQFVCQPNDETMCPSGWLMGHLNHTEIPMDEISPEDPFERVWSVVDHASIFMHPSSNARQLDGASCHTPFGELDHNVLIYSFTAPEEGTYHVQLENYFRNDEPNEDYRIETVSVRSSCMDIETELACQTKQPRDESNEPYNIPLELEAEETIFVILHPFASWFVIHDQDSGVASDDALFTLTVRKE